VNVVGLGATGLAGSGAFINDILAWFEYLITRILRRYFNGNSNSDL
jgi:hypothetical protein